MKFKTGDKVKFLNDTGGGEIIRIIDQKMVVVRIDDGFEIPVATNELVTARENFYEKNYEKDETVNTDKKQVTKKKEEPKIQLKADLRANSRKEVFIGFIPEDEYVVNSDIHFYLINDGDFSISYFIGYMENTSWYYLKHGVLEDNTKLKIKKFDQAGISKVKKINVQLIFLSSGRYFPQQPVNTFIDIENTRFYKESTFKENDFFEKKGLIIAVNALDVKEKLADIASKDIAFAIKEKEKTLRQEKPVISDTEEVDLHVHEITDDYRDLSPGEILNIQMGRFTIALEGAILAKKKKIVFIHGVGNGKLKYEISKTLKEKHPDLVFQDASFKEYGFGATMVFLK
jgi:hypothetical protein